MKYKNLRKIYDNREMGILRAFFEPRGLNDDFDEEIAEIVRCFRLKKAFFGQIDKSLLIRGIVNLDYNAISGQQINNLLSAIDNKLEELK